MSDNRALDGILGYFRCISDIPRGSGNEKGIADYLCDFAKENSLDHYRDGNNNVLITKPASAGFTSSEPIMFQGHTDMVCEKEQGSEHDFLKDGLELTEKGGYISASGTTLGADDGIAVAVMMYMLTDEELEHPPLECLFTSSEEVGMIGAKAFDYSRINAKRLINLDSEDFSEVIVSCAGGVRVSAHLEKDYMPFPKNVRKAVRIDIGGLAGGHSGSDIHMGKMNALAVMGEFLSAFYKEAPFNILSVSGGTKDNAIARTASAVISVDTVDRAKKFASAFEKKMRSLAVSEDRKLFIHVNREPGEHTKMLTFACTSKVIDCLTFAPYGVMKMSPTMPGLVLTSSNPGSVTDEDRYIKFVHLARSSSEHELDMLQVKFERMYRRIGTDNCFFSDRYPGWEYSGQTDIAEAYGRAYEKVTGNKVVFKALHAGLECGIIKHNCPDMEIISVGPDISDIHTPGEKLKTDTVGALYEILTLILSGRE